MAKQLFIVCPFSCMETYLQQRYGNAIFFLTCTGAVFQFQNFEYSLEVRDLILREKINSICIVNDTSCRFIHGVVKRNKMSGLPSHRAIEALYVDNYFSCFKDQPLHQQIYMLAKLNVKGQIQEVLNSPLLGSYISEFNIEVKGLITSKELNFCKEIQITNNNTLHEL